MNKKFSQELCDLNDHIAKNTAIEFLIEEKLLRLKDSLVNQKEMFSDYDFIMIDSNNKEIKIEVEKKNSWKCSGKWENFKTITIPERKRKSQADIFVMVNEKCDTLMCSKMENIINSPVIWKYTIYSRNIKESFFDVSLDKCEFYYKVNEFLWQRITPC